MDPTAGILEQVQGDCRIILKDSRAFIFFFKIKRCVKKLTDHAKEIVRGRDLISGTEIGGKHLIN